jgi:hypothetical protein
MPKLVDLDDVLLTPAVAAAWFDPGAPGGGLENTLWRLRF